MTEPKWTPGKWSVGELHSTMVSDEDGCLIADCDCCREHDEANARLIAAAPTLYAALEAAIKIADEAREEWDKAPAGMRAGKILIALSGGCPRYRADIDQIHAALRAARGEPEDG